MSAWTASLMAAETRARAATERLYRAMRDPEATVDALNGLHAAREACESSWRELREGEEEARILGQAEIPGARQGRMIREAAKAAGDRR